MDGLIPPPEEILQRLRLEHPRLLASAHDFTALGQQSGASPDRGRWLNRVRKRAERVLAEAPSRYEIPDGMRLLSTSRRVLDRVYTLALLYRLDGDERYAERAWQELRTAAAFVDWNPSHFLDTAEMTHAFAIGYDWLHDRWDEAQRAALRAAIIEKGLKPALECYRGTASFGKWVKAPHNWNQVCNGGIGMGALAIAEDEPELAGEILRAALQSLPLAMEQFAPDGAWAEGPGYWRYATYYNVVFLAALETALGTDFGLSRTPGFSETGFFPIYLTGPLGRTFNYADGSDSAIRAPQMFWLARRFQQPAYAVYQRRVGAPRALDLLWFDPQGDTQDIDGAPLDRYFRGAEVVTFRSRWDDPDALFIGFKAGHNKVNHSHLDLGTFVLDALGSRWAVDLGADDYNLPGYWGKKRWTYYRMRAEGHNTLVLNPGADPDQDPAAVAPILRFRSDPEEALAIADLTPAYAHHAQRVWRGLQLRERRQVLVQDEIEAEKPVEVWWSMHTPATVRVSDDGQSATLTQGEARLWARLLSPAVGRFTVMVAEPLPTSPRPDGQARNEGVRKLAIRLDDATDVRLAVLLVPLREEEGVPARLPEVTPLAEW
jgi:hypothetical protein